MRRLQNRALACVGAAAALIALPLFPFGLPVGLWSLAVLRQEDVRRGFEQIASVDNFGTQATSCRFSRFAIGAATLAILPVVSNMTISFWSGRPEPTHDVEFVLKLIYTLLQWPALGAVLLAWVAWEDMRRAGGRLRGAGLALFALLFPFIHTTIYEVGLWFRGISPTEQSVEDALQAERVRGIVALLLSSAAAVWVHWEEQRRVRAGQAGSAWWLFTAQVRGFITIAFVLIAAWATVQRQVVYREAAPALANHARPPQSSGIIADKPHAGTRVAALPKEELTIDLGGGRFVQSDASRRGSILQVLWIDYSAAVGQLRKERDQLPIDSERTRLTQEFNKTWLAKLEDGLSSAATNDPGRTQIMSEIRPLYASTGNHQMAIQSSISLIEEWEKFGRRPPAHFIKAPAEFALVAYYEPGETVTYADLTRLFQSAYKRLRYEGEEAQAEELKESYSRHFIFNERLEVIGTKIPKAVPRVGSVSSP